MGVQDLSPVAGRHRRFGFEMYCFVFSLEVYPMAVCLMPLP